VIKLRSEQFATRKPKKEKAAAAIVATNTMKRLVVFILLLSLFIVGEYYFLTELITQKRAWVISASLLVTVICLYFLIRFFKHSLISSRSTGS
jgi:cation transport ATPase